MKPHTCSTFVLTRDDHLLVGHNLDDYIPVPGLIFINKRGVVKHNISWDDLRLARIKSRPRIQWVSKYGSITCNAFGKEFPDGGMNEAGLYVGEMTLLGTIYPSERDRPKIYHHQWIQYLLDNYDTVEQVLNEIGKITVDGHCQWHFFIADASGQTAIIEFIKGEMIIYTGANMPVKVLCNTAYADELIAMQKYESFGGKEPVDFGDKSGGLRFVQAATMLQQNTQPDDLGGFAFAILQQLDCGNNKWKIVFDLSKRCMYYKTWLADDIRTANLASFDLSNNAPEMMLDINQDKAGDVTEDFLAYDEALNRQYIEEMWKGIDLGFMLNTFFKPMMISRLSDYPKAFRTR